MTLFQDRPHIRTETKPLDIFPITKGFQFRLGNGILISRQTATEPEFHLSFEILTQFFRRFNQFQDAFLLYHPGSKHHLQGVRRRLRHILKHLQINSRALDESRLWLLHDTMI